MGKIILVAEDYDDTRAFMVTLIKSYGYEVYEATNGLEAIEIAKEHPPNLILMDISMPLMDGLTATRIIRNSVIEISQVPIIAISAFGNILKDKALKAGCTDFISKPINFDTLEPMLEKYLAR